jgi:pimeloyl-ACP methyl ester carboxylesterase
MSTWILLRGLTRETRHWGMFPDAFERIVGAADAGARVVTLELPGNGEANAEPSPVSVADFVVSVRDAARQQIGSGPYRVLAMSLGGMVATAWAQHYPQDIERLVLINTSMRPFCSVTQRLRPSAWARLAWVAANWRRADACERAIHSMTCRAQDTHDRDANAWAAIRRTRPVSARNALRQLYAAARFEAKRPAPTCPTLMLSSAADGLVNPVCSARIASHWAADHLEHPWAGHDLPHDDPDWTAESVRHWLASLECHPLGEGTAVALPVGTGVVYGASASGAA